jgi:hypothetical protein
MPSSIPALRACSSCCSRKTLLLAAGAHLLLGIVQVALRAIHQVEVQVGQLGQIAEVLGLEGRELLARGGNLFAVLLRLGA